MAKGCKASGTYLTMKEHLFKKTVLHLDILLPCSSSWVVVVVVVVEGLSLLNEGINCFSVLVFQRTSMVALD